MSDSSKTGNSPQMVHGHRARCADCSLSFHVYDATIPVTCPYCGRPLAQSQTTFPLAKPVKLPTTEEVNRRQHALYNPPSAFIIVLIVIVTLLLFSWALWGQVQAARNFHYQRLVTLYSIISGIFVSSRFIFAAFYMPPRDSDIKPSVSVLVPCMNEGSNIRQTIERIFAAGYPQDLLDVICVNDGSTDNTLQEMLKSQTIHPRMIIVDFERNRGLCHGWAVAMTISQSDVIVCVDSDTFVFPGSLSKLVRGFADPQVGGISGHCDIENANVNMLTRMQDVRYFFSYKVMKAAESLFETVSCLPGCFSAYRRECIIPVLNDWMNATVFGKHGNFADDRSLTNRVLEHYKVVYDDQALATTICPEGWYQYIRQQARWQRSYLREIPRAGKWMWKKHPVAAIGWYAMMWLPILEPFVMVMALVVAPIMALDSGGAGGGGSAVAIFDYTLGVFSITLVWALHFWACTGRRWWACGLLFTVTYIFFFSWQLYWAFFTLSGKKWGTR